MFNPFKVQKGERSTFSLSTFNIFNSKLYFYPPVGDFNVFFHVTNVAKASVHLLLVESK